jgi:hypothetical protein
MIGMVIALPVTIGVWLGIYYGLPPLAGMGDLLARFAFAINCSCLAVLLCLLTGIEAVAHERLHSEAFDPLAGRESLRLKINLRYLQNTVEQLLLFLPGVLGLSFYCSDGSSMRAVAASSVVWIVTRAVFWIGYHVGPQYRVIGLTGMLQSILVLLYVSARFGYDLGGVPGAIIPIVLFAGIEAVLVIITRRPAANPAPTKAAGP